MLVLVLVKPQTDGSALLYNDVKVAQRYVSEKFITSNDVVILDTDKHAWLKRYSLSFFFLDDG